MSDRPTIDIGAHVDRAMAQYSGELDDRLREIFREAFSEWLHEGPPGGLNTNADRLLEIFARRVKERATSLRGDRV